MYASTMYRNYSAGATLDVFLRLDNVGNETEIVDIAGCPAGFRVQDADLSDVYDSLAHATCPSNKTSRALQPGLSISYNFRWDQRNDSGVQVPAPAWYRILGYWTGGSSSPIDIVSWPTFIGLPVSTFRLAFSIRTDRETYTLGETANVSIALTNVGNGTAVLNFGNPCFDQLLAFNDSGQEVYNTSRFWGCIEVLWGITLAPGASVTHTFPWSLTTNEGKPLPVPEMYRLVPSFKWGRLYQDSVVRTETATIYVSA